MARFFFPLLQRKSALRALPVLALSALVLCLGIGMASAQLSAQKRAQHASVGGYTLVNDIAIMVAPCGSSGGQVSGTVSLSGSGNEAIAVSIGGPGATPSSCDLIPGQSCSFTGTLPTEIGGVATYVATAKGRKTRGGKEETFRKETKSTVRKKQWKPEPAPATLHLYGRVADPSQGGKNSDGGYAPGTPVRVFVDNASANATWLMRRARPKPIALRPALTC